MAKRIFDIVFSAAGLVVFSPVLIALAAIIKAGDGGPVFYRGERAGLGGKPFRIFKFRTMVPDAEKIGGPSTSDGDSRVTAVGGFLRRYKLDELPQLFNVFCGEMSFVGPRPEVLSEIARYDDEQRKLLSVRPGITGYASIKFHNEGEILKGQPDPHEAYRRLIQPEKIRLGLEYVGKSSLAVDVKIIFMTLKTLCRAGWHER